MASQMQLRYPCQECTALFGVYADFLVHLHQHHNTRPPISCLNYELKFILCSYCIKRVVENSVTDGSHLISITLCDKCCIINNSISPDLDG